MGEALQVSFCIAWDLIFPAISRFDIPSAILKRNCEPRERGNVLEAGGAAGCRADFAGLYGEAQALDHRNLLSNPKNWRSSRLSAVCELGQ